MCGVTRKQCSLICRHLPPSGSIGSHLLLIMVVMYLDYSCSHDVLGNNQNAEVPIYAYSIAPSTLPSCGRRLTRGNLNKTGAVSGVCRRSSA